MIAALGREACEVICVGHRPERAFPYGPAFGSVRVTCRGGSRVPPSFAPWFPYLNFPLFRQFTLAIAYVIVTLRICIQHAYRPSAVISYNPYPYTMVAAWALARVRQVAWLCVAADFIASPIGRIVARRLGRRLHGVVALSARLAEIFRDVPAVIVPGGIRKGRVAASAVVEPSGAVPVGLYAGSLQPAAGVGLLVRALARVDSQPLKIVIVGHGDRGWLDHAASRDSRLDVRGFISEEELPVLMAKSDFFLAPREAGTEYSEGTFPSKILYYLEYGKPILASPDGLPDDFLDCLTVVHGADIEWGTAIERQAVEVVRGSMESRIVAPCVKELAARYTWESQAKQVLSLLRR